MKKYSDIYIGYLNMKLINLMCELNRTKLFSWNVRKDHNNFEIIIIYDSHLINVYKN